MSEIRESENKRHKALLTMQVTFFITVGYSLGRGRELILF